MVEGHRTPSGHHLLPEAGVGGLHGVGVLLQLVDVVRLSVANLVEACHLRAKHVTQPREPEARFEPKRLASDVSMLAHAMLARRACFPGLAETRKEFGAELENFKPILCMPFVEGGKLRSLSIWSFDTLLE